MAARVYFFLAESISTSVFSLSSTLSLMMLDAVLESARVLIRTWGLGEIGNRGGGQGEGGAGVVNTTSQRSVQLAPNFIVPPRCYRCLNIDAAFNALELLNLLLC